MIKLTGICILFLAARLFYENYIDKNEETAKKAENIILFSDLLYVNVMELKMPLERGISSLKFKISPFIDEFIENVTSKCAENPHLSVREIFLKQFSKINADRKIKREMNRFFSVVGNSDKETVLSYKKIAVKNCEAYLAEYRRNSENKRKTAGAMTFGVSAILTIILL